CSLKADMALLALVLFFVSRIGAGIAGATISTAQAVVADCTPPERRKHGMALIGAAFGIGFTFGPLIGAGALYASPAHYELIGYTAAALSLIALLLGIWLLPETRQFGTESPHRRRWFDWSAWRFALANPAIAPVVLTFFLASFGFGGFESTLALLLRDSFGLDPENSFLMFAYVGFVLMLAQGFFYRRLASRVSEVTFMAMGIVLMAIGVGSLGAVSYLATEAQQTWLRAAHLHTVGTAGEGLYSLLATQHPAAAAGALGNRNLMPYLFVGLTAAVFGFAFLTPS